MNKVECPHTITLRIKIKIVNKAIGIKKKKYSFKDNFASQIGELNHFGEIIKDKQLKILDINIFAIL